MPILDKIKLILGNFDMKRQTFAHALRAFLSSHFIMPPDFFIAPHLPKKMFYAGAATVSNARAGGARRETPSPNITVCLLKLALCRFII